jgi:hypothetical protein
VRARVTATLALVFLALAVGCGHAQAPVPQASAPPPSVPGFVPPYEIMRTVRAAGFDPLAPPLREGTVYVLRATDFRGILMRVVVDARTGAIRDANRILPGQGSYGPDSARVGVVPLPFESPDDMPLDRRPPHPEVPPPPFTPTAKPASPRPPLASAVTRAAVPPLPRPRPAALAARKPGEEAKPDIASDPKPAPAVDPKPDANASVTGAVPPAPAPPAAPPPAAPAKPKPPSTLTINN